MNENWSVPRILNHELRILFRSQLTLLDEELRFYSAKERREDHDKNPLPESMHPGKEHRRHIL